MAKSFHVLLCPQGHGHGCYYRQLSAKPASPPLDQQGMLFSQTALAYLNRLSSLCFVLELMAAQNEGSTP